MQPIGKVDFAALSLEEAGRRVLSSALDRTSRHVHLLNVYSVTLADRDADYRSTVTGDAWNFPDGKPLSWVSRARRDRPRLSQVRGTNLFRHVMDQGRTAGTKHYLLGSTEQTLVSLEARLRQTYPGVEIVGSFSPPFRAATADELVERDAAIERSGAHIVWVGLGTPKQDVEAARLAGSLPVVAIAVGAAFDFVAGTAKEAPVVFRRLGMEWAYRLVTEPRRLWRRYVIGNPQFFGIVIREQLRSRR